MSQFLVIGGSGFLGRNLRQVLGDRARATYSSHPFERGIHFDARRQRFAEMAENLPDLRWVILTHGACNVDYCAAQAETSYDLNVRRMIQLADDVRQAGLMPIYVSTDYVFDGTRGLRSEDETVCPTTAYGRQKAEVEAWLKETGAPHLICRASKLVSGDLDTHSVLGQWVADVREGRLIRCATDQVFSPALVSDVARGIILLAEAGKTGVYHVVGPEPLSRFELGKLFVDAIKVVAPRAQVQFEACRLSDIKFVEPRPLDTSLSADKVRSELGLECTDMAQVCRTVALKYFSTLNRSA